MAPNAALKTFLKASVLKPLNVLLLILLLLQAVESTYSATFGYKFDVGFTVEFCKFESFQLELSRPGFRIASLLGT